MTPSNKKNYSKVDGVSERIAQALLESGMSQREVASKMKVFPTAISRWKTGVTEPTPSNLNALAKILSVDVNWLISGVADSKQDLPNTNLDNIEVEMLKDELIAQMKKHQILGDKYTAVVEELAEVKAELAGQKSAKSKPLAKRKMGQ